MMSCLNHDHLTKPDFTNCSLCRQDRDEKIQEEFKMINDKLDILDKKRVEFVGTIFLLEQEIKKISLDIDNH